VLCVRGCVALRNQGVMLPLPWVCMTLYVCLKVSAGMFVGLCVLGSAFLQDVAPQNRSACCFNPAAALWRQLQGRHHWHVDVVVWRPLQGAPVWVLRHWLSQGAVGASHHIYGCCVEATAGGLVAPLFVEATAGGLGRRPGPGNGLGVWPNKLGPTMQVALY
jgi:hypothetical protein